MIEHYEAGVQVRVKQCIIYKTIVLNQSEMWVSESFKIHVISIEHRYMQIFIYTHKNFSRQAECSLGFSI